MITILRCSINPQQADHTNIWHIINVLGNSLFTIQMTRSNSGIHLKLCSWLPSMSQNSSSISLCFSLTLQGSWICEVPWSFHLAKPACQASSYGLVAEPISLLWGTAGSYERGLDYNQLVKWLLAELQEVSIDAVISELRSIFHRKKTAWRLFVTVNMFSLSSWLTTIKVWFTHRPRWW